MIELISFSPEDKIFHFYELIGNGVSGEWFHRGSSLDIYLDNKNLYLNNIKEKKYGNRLRCSACHVNGGAIIKEEKAPNNAWKTKKFPFKFKSLIANEEVQSLLIKTQDAYLLSQEIAISNSKLLLSNQFHKTLSKLNLKEVLRPLFCEQEVQLASDSKLHDTQIEIPSGFFLNPLLGNLQIKVDRKLFLSILKDLKFQFPESNQLTDSHAFITPIKSSSDLLWIQNLIQRGIVTKSFVQKISMIDFMNPVFSEKRCSLINQLPTKTKVNWSDQFIKNLEIDSNLSNSINIQEFKKSCQKNSSSKEWLKKTILGLKTKRELIKRSDISKNPRGQILEPGFRVVFPESPLFSEDYFLNENCEWIIAN
ncbi:hypothetical protein MJH12_17530 [bacterium]|nr:hypothetical protein [bacterium]